MSTQKIFGLGFPKTGTTTLERAHEILGYKVCKGHWNNNHTNYLLGLYVNGDFEGISKVVEHFDAFFDAPWGGGNLYKWLLNEYPGAKFVLSIRDSEAWLRSLSGMFEGAVGQAADLSFALHANGRYGAARFWESVFGLEDFRQDWTHVQKVYEETNKRVREVLNHVEADFLEVDVTEGDGWEKLCRFLGCPVPGEPFPHANPGTETGRQSRNLTLREALGLARQRYAEGRLPAAKIICERILEKFPNQSEAKSLLATVHVARGEVS